MSAAAQEAGVCRQTVYLPRKADPAFDLAVLEALEEGTEYLEDVATRRAVEGVRRVKSYY